MRIKRSYSIMITAILLFIISIPITFLLLSLLFTQYEVLDKLCTPLLGCIHVNKGFLYYFFNLIIFGFLPLTSAIGIITRKPLGWWLSLFFFATTLLFQALELVRSIIGKSTSSVYLINLIIIIVCLILIFLFTRRKIINLFQIKIQNKVVIYILFTGITVINYFLYELVLLISSNPTPYGN